LSTAPADGGNQQYLQGKTGAAALAKVDRECSTPMIKQ
jgi:hypothetical protein